MQNENICAVKYENSSLYILDQRRLPHEKVMEKQNTIEDVFNSIKTLKVRGAPAIGVVSAYGLLIGIKKGVCLSKDDFFDMIEKMARYLISCRPTAVNLSFAVNRMFKVAEDNMDKENAAVYFLLEEEAKKIHKEDMAICQAIGEHGEKLIKDKMGILTHCNAGALATSGIGTALAPIYKAHSLGKKIKVYADETRPLLQGARITAFELSEAGVETVVICDNMASFVMSKGLIDMIITGCDRVAKNGDAANKIGTSNLAILAKYFNIPFYIACPSTTFDKATENGEKIIIEEREHSEVLSFAGVRTTPQNVSCINPAFDVTPSSLITGFITEKGVINPPFEKNLISCL